MSKCLSIIIMLSFFPGSASAENKNLGCKPYDGKTLTGIAYSLWHNSVEELDTWWGSPVSGRYLSSDRSAQIRHAKELSDAGVDFVYVDWSNNIDTNMVTGKGKQIAIERNTVSLFDSWSKSRKHPYISIMIGITGSPEAVSDGRLSQKADEVYNVFVASRFKDIYMTYIGKPLLIVYVNAPSPNQHGLPDWTDPRFTVRYMTGFLTDQPSLIQSGNRSRYGYLSWEDRRSPSYSVLNGVCEAVNIVAAWRGNHRNPSRGRDDAKTFLKGWDFAIALHPRILLLGTFNEWRKGEQESVEQSKDIESSKELGTRYIDIIKDRVKILNLSNY